MPQPVQIVCIYNNEIVGSIKLSYKAQAEADSIAAVVEAYDIALGKVLRKTVEWTLTTGQLFWTGA